MRPRAERDKKVIEQKKMARAKLSEELIDKFIELKAFYESSGIDFELIKRAFDERSAAEQWICRNQGNEDEALLQQQESIIASLITKK